MAWCPLIMTGGVIFLLLVTTKKWSWLIRYKIFHKFGSGRRLPLLLHPSNTPFLRRGFSLACPTGEGGMQLLRCIRGPLKIHEENFVSDKAREEPLTFVSDKARRLKYLKANIYLRSQVLTVIVQPGHVDSTLDRGEQLSPVRVTDQQGVCVWVCVGWGGVAHLHSPGIDRP